MVNKIVKKLLPQAVECLAQSPPPAGGSQQPLTFGSASTRSSPPPTYCPSRAGQSRKRNSLFQFGTTKKTRGKRSSVKIWSLDVICLAYTDSSGVPSAAERSKLLAAGMNAIELDCEYDSFKNDGDSSVNANI